MLLIPYLKFLALYKINYYIDLLYLIYINIIFAVILILILIIDIIPLVFTSKWCIHLNFID